jgi:hypothetical protein
MRLLCAGDEYHWSEIEVVVFFYIPFKKEIVMGFSYSRLIVAGVLFAGVSGASAARIAVKIARVDDNRVYSSPGAAQPMFNSNPPGLTITLHAFGPMANSAASYGKLTLTAARDNLGDVLRIASPSSGGFPMPGQSKGRHKIQRQPAGFGGPAPSGFDVPLHLTEPPRKALRITLLQGSFRVTAGGRLNTVTINPMASMGRSIHSPTLAKAGLQIKILKAMPMGGFMPGPGNQSLILAIGGNKTALEKVKILNTSGSSIFAGFTSSSDQNGAKISSYQLKRPLKAGDKVNLIVAVGQKMITVPFDFRNIKLP